MTVTVVVKPASKGTITNTVSVQAEATSPPDPNSSNNTSSETTRVT